MAGRIGYVSVREKERGRESEEEGGGECVCKDLMVKKVANVVILNS